jgi:large subunit ribosomal protein L10
MPLTKDKKKQVVEETGQLIDSSKLIVFARYPGTSVKAMQELRQTAGSSQTTVRIIKNRLFKLALDSRPIFKDVEPKLLSGQLLYAFNPADEVAPAQALATFAKTNPNLEFVGAITQDGQLLSVDEVKHLAALPSKQQLRGVLAGTISAPLTSFLGVISGNVRGLINVLNAKAQI